MRAPRAAPTTSFAPSSNGLAGKTHPSPPHPGTQDNSRSWSPCRSPDRTPARRFWHRPPSSYRSGEFVREAARVVEETPIAAPAAQSAQETPLQSRIVTIVSVIGLCLALAFGSFLLLGDGGKTRPSAAPLVASKPAPLVVTYTHATSAAAHAASAPTLRVQITISAGLHASWLEIRRGSATGRGALLAANSPLGRPSHRAGHTALGALRLCGQPDDHREWPPGHPDRHLRARLRRAQALRTPVHPIQ